jgi:hypothetical protein
MIAHVVGSGIEETALRYPEDCAIPSAVSHETHAKEAKNHHRPSGGLRSRSRHSSADVTISAVARKIFETFLRTPRPPPFQASWLATSASIGVPTVGLARRSVIAYVARSKRPMFNDSMPCAAISSETKAAQRRLSKFQLRRLDQARRKECLSFLR